jgi:hypothetical protein
MGFSRFRPEVLSEDGIDGIVDLERPGEWLRSRTLCPPSIEHG